MTKLLRITTVPISLKTLLKGQHNFMSENGFHVLGVSSSGKELQELANQEEIEVVIIEMTRVISPLKDLKALFQIYKLCKKERPNIVHSHTPKAGFLAMLGSRLAGVPIRLHTVAGLPLMEATGIRRTVLDFVEKLTYKCCTHIYPNSKGLYDFILQNNFAKKEKLKVIANGSSNGIDIHYFDKNLFPEYQKRVLKSFLRIDFFDFVFIYIGRLVGDKGINELVAAFIQLKLTNSKLLLVGSFEHELDPLQPETLEEIKKNTNIISVGFQADVRPYFAISDCLVFPSYREGFPNVVMQAGAMELPCIVTDINGCNEIIIEGENGSIIPVKNVKVIMEAMQRMYADNDYYNHLRKNARPLIQSRFEQKMVWEELVQEYNRLLSNV